MSRVGLWLAAKLHYMYHQIIIPKKLFLKIRITIAVYTAVNALHNNYTTGINCMCCLILTVKLSIYNYILDYNAACCLHAGFGYN